MVKPPLHRPRRSSKVRYGAAAIVVGGALLLSGCSKQSIISNASPQAHGITVLWWWMLGVAALVFLGAVVLLVIGYVTRRRPGLPFLGQREIAAQGLVLVFGIGIPLGVLVALFGVSDIYLIRQTAAPAPRTTALTIHVIGHQWWWEVRYDGGHPVTANEIHIPVRTRVNLVATTADVIHSFWVPQLNRKIDMIPGQRNRILLYADRTGKYRGQCSQFCGLQHANMGMFVIAQPQSAFRAWLAHTSRRSSSPTTPQARAGKQLFLTSQCASCHFIAGTPAQGTIGPDLTHVASRSTLAAATIPNTPRELADWIHNPQAIKPGVRMPDLGLSWRQVDRIVAYLEELK
ncbi:MAG: c-type cytochrome [Solirubrobacterales bacterium]|nr:c-type cytochrome [Solirubrobacterales bacterium]